MLLDAFLFRVFGFIPNCVGMLWPYWPLAVAGGKESLMHQIKILYNSRQKRHLCCTLALIVGALGCFALAAGIPKQGFSIGNGDFADFDLRLSYKGNFAISNYSFFFLN